MNTFIQDVVAEAIKRQSFYQRNRNTIHAGIGAIVGLLGFLATLPLPIKDEYAAFIPVVAAFLTAFVVKLSPNGIQPSTADKLENTTVALSTLPDVGAISAEAARMAPSAVAIGNDLQSEVQRWLDTAVPQAEQAAESLHDQGVALGQEVQEFIGRHRAP